MAETCWCGKELVVKSGAPDFIGDTLELVTNHYVCPEHGAGYVWRPCRLAEGLDADENPEYPKPARYCRAFRGFVVPIVCAPCPVPDLVEACEAMSREECWDFDAALSAARAALAKVVALKEEES